MEQAYGEAEAFVNRVKQCVRAQKEMEFFLGMAEKMLLSALIDADWLDSAISGAGGQLDFGDLDGETAFCSPPGRCPCPRRPGK